jgi:hypothetical protein
VGGARRGRGRSSHGATRRRSRAGTWRPGASTPGNQGRRRRRRATDIRPEPCGGAREASPRTQRAGRISSRPRPATGPAPLRHQPPAGSFPCPNCQDDWRQRGCRHSVGHDSRAASPASGALGRRCRQLDPPRAATLTSPRPDPHRPRTVQRGLPGETAAADNSEFRRHCTLNGSRGAVRRVRLTKSGGHGAARTIPRAALWTRTRWRLRSGGAGTAPSPSGGSRVTGPGRHRARRQRPRRGESRTGGRSAPPAIPYSTSYTCRHRNPPDPGNAQAVAGINLPVDSQTYLRAKLVKQ